MNQVFVSIKKSLNIGLVAIILMTTILTSLFSTTMSQAYGSPVYTGNIKHASLDRVGYVRSWRDVAVYDLKTQKAVAHYPKGKTFRVSRLAYKKGMFFYLDAHKYNQGKFYGVIVNRVFSISHNGQAAFNNHIVPIKDGMPLSQHRSKGGTCTASRVWHVGLHPDLRRALQKTELHLGRHVPITTGYRTYNEQACLFSKNPDPTYVARPGTSMHNKGLAVDIDKSFSQTHASTLSSFGLCRPMSYEPWHWEPCGAR